MHADTLGLCQQFNRAAALRSGFSERAIMRGVRQWQSKHAERVFLEMLEKAEVPVHYEQFLERVRMDGTRITGLEVRGGDVYQAKVFIDATYEGDLMAAAGVSHVVGREARETYGEARRGCVTWMRR